MGSERRRSERIMFTIPIDVRGADEQGAPFSAGGRTITLNRHGARIQISRLLRTGQVVQIINQNTDAQAPFRVVGPLSPPSEKVGEWGVECQNPEENIWGIHFPPLSPGSGAKALLECRKCHTPALSSLTMVEVEVVDTAGLLSRPCEKCGGVTPWGRPEQQLAAEGALALGFPPPSPDLRSSPRATVLVPARLRDFYGETEVTQTENTSKDGLCFTSERDYYIGQGIMVVCPYDPSNQHLEVRGRVVRREPLLGTQRKIYGVSYERKPA